MRYQPLEPVSASEAEEKFTSGDSQTIAESLISTALHLPDRAWVETWLVRLSGHGDPNVRRAASLSLGHLARLHGEVGTAALAAVQGLLGDAELSGAAQDALDDVEIFTRPK